MDKYRTINKYQALDMCGRLVRIGDKAVWYDPDRSARDTERIWEVYDIRGEIVYLADDYGEAEVYPHEIRIIIQ